MSGSVTKACLICGNQFNVKPSRAHQKCCSNTCRGQARRVPDEQLRSKYRASPAPKDHPLYTGYPAIRTHRLVLWEKIGPGAHPCHHCGVEVRWQRETGSEDALVVDHLDRNSLNNDPENLVPACHPCNVRNSSKIVADDEEYVPDGPKYRRRATRRTCPVCVKEFVARAGSARPRCCSVSCGQIYRRRHSRTA